MKSTNLLIVFTLVIRLSLSSQSCLPEGITFSTQQEIDDFQINYPNCSHIEGSVLISGDDINNLLGLNSVDSIGGDLSIGWYYWSNPQLSSIVGLDSISYIGGDLYIEENAALIDLTGLTSLQKIGGSLHISFNHALKKIGSLNNLTVVGEDVRIQSNYAMNYLNGLNGLTHIEGTLEFYHNDNLINLSGIENITQTGNLSLIHNHILENIDALNNLISIDGTLYISYNYGLIDLRGLENTISIDGALYVRFNNGLTSLEGIDNIVSSTIGPLYINNNPLLTTCEVQSVCDYLAGPHGNCMIIYNALGCNSIEEVEVACLSIGLQELNTNPEFSLFPCPTNGLLYISSKNEVCPREVVIDDQCGKSVLSCSYTKDGIDLSKLSPGFYIVEIITKNHSIKGKIIKH